MARSDALRTQKAGCWKIVPIERRMSRRAVKPCWTRRRIGARCSSVWTQAPARQSRPCMPSATAASAPGSSTSSELSQLKISPLAMASPLLMALACPVSFSTITAASTGRKRSMMSTDPSVLAPSTTISSRSGYPWSSTDLIALAMYLP